MFFIFSEIGEKVKIPYNENNNILYSDIELLFKKIGVTKYDIELLDINKQDLFEYTNGINSNITNKNIIYIYSINEKYEIYKNYFLNIFKNKSVNPSLLSFEEEVSDEKNLDDLYCLINKTFNLFHKVNNSISDNLQMIDNLLKNNILNISNSIQYLLDFLKKQINDTGYHYNNLETSFNSISSQIISLQEKYQNINSFKLSLNSDEEKTIFEKLFNERKIKIINEKIIKNYSFIKEKFTKNQHNYDEIKKIIEENSFQKFENIIEKTIIEEIKSEYFQLNNTFKELENIQFLDDLKQIENENNKNEIKDKYSKIISNNTIYFLYNQSGKLFDKLKQYIIEKIIKEFFSYSSKIFSIINSLKKLKTKFLSYLNILINLQNDINSLFSEMQEEINYKIYFNEYIRRISFLQNLKYEIENIKKEIKNENTLRNKFMEELFLENKSNEFINNNDIKNFFEWPDIKINIDIFADIYYQNAIIKERQNNDFEIKINERLYELNHINLNYQHEIQQLKEELNLTKNNLMDIKNDIIKIKEILDDIYNNKNTQLNNNSFKESYIINKTFFNYYNSILSLKNTELNKYYSFYNKLFMKKEDLYSYYNIINNNSLVNISKVNKGDRIILFPKSGIYYGLIIEENNSKVLCQYILDMENLEDNIKKKLEKKLFFIIGIVREIIKEIDKTDLNQFIYKLSLSKIEYIFGTEKINNNLILKNYI